eukprot:g8112.t1
MSENSTEPLPSEEQDNSPDQTVDGAIHDARSRLSLFKDQLVNLSYDLTQSSTELDVITEKNDENNSTPPSPPALNNKEDAKDNLQEVVSETGSLSEDNDAFQPALDFQEGSSSSSRSWSTGFGGNGMDLIPQPKPQQQQQKKESWKTGSQQLSSHHRRFDSPYQSEFYQDSPKETKQFPSGSKKDNSASTEGWILNSILPFSCWPTEEAGDFRWVAMKQQTHRTSKTKTLPVNQGGKISKISQAVRSAIGKIWDESSTEISLEIFKLVQSMLMEEEADADQVRSKIDPLSCWISGRALIAVADGLPFALTIHTCTSVGKPCVSGHANVTVEITSLDDDDERTDVFEKQEQNLEQSAYRMSSKSSSSISEATSPANNTRKMELLSLDIDSSPALYSIHGQNEEPSGSEKHQRRPMGDKDAGGASASTFSFNSVNEDKQDRESPSPGSSDTFLTADLTAFIRQEGQRQGPELNSSGQNRVLDLTDKNRTVNRQRTVFSELDLVWEMQYPNFDTLETVIASRKYKQNEETSHQSHQGVTSEPNTYFGDTDSDSSLKSEPLDASQNLPVQPTHEILSGRQSRSGSTDSSDPRITLDQSMWQSGAQDCGPMGCMEAIMDDQERRRRWGRVQKLSSFVRRVRKLIRSSAPSDAKRHQQSSRFDTIQESPEQDQVVQFYSPEPSIASERHQSTSPNGDKSTEGFYSAPSSESDFGEPDLSPRELRSPDTRQSMDSSNADQALFLTGTSFASSLGLASQTVLWDESRSMKLPVKDLGNGQYLALGHLTGEGRYQISVKIGNRKISKTPFVTFVMDPNSLGSGVGNDGPFFQRPDCALVAPSSTIPIPHPKFPPCHSIAYDPDRLEYALRHPHLGFVDILFIVDCTSSMGQELKQLLAVLQGIQQLVKDSVLLKRLKVGIIAYRDHDPEDEDTFLLRTQDLTEDIEKVQRFLNGLEAEGGGDYPEAMEVAFAEAVEGIKWSLFSARFVLWIGDAPPHGYQGFTRKQAIKEEQKFKGAKATLKKTARAVDLAMKNKNSPRQVKTQDEELANALNACDAIAKYHDRYPLGFPGGVRWEETIERLASLGVRTLVMGLRDAISHESSRNCLRTIAHISGGALLEIVDLESSIIAPLVVAIVEQSLDHQLIEEEVCDLILCLKNDFENQSLEDKRRNLIESMSQAAKQPHRLQVAPNGCFSESLGSSRGDLIQHEFDHQAFRSTTASKKTLGPLTISKGNLDDIDSSIMDSRALLLGMVSIRFDEDVLEQALKNLRSKAEVVSHCLLSNFESMKHWADFHLSHVSDGGLYKGQRNKIAGLTTPLSLRYILALKTMAQQRD